MTLRSDDLIDEQKKAIDECIKWFRHGSQFGFKERPRFILNGPAGSGKSTIAYFILEAIGLSPTSDEVANVAYTGKATMVMKSKGLINARTIHSSIYLPQDDIGNELKTMRNRITMLRGELSKITIPEDRVTANVDIERLTADLIALQENSDGDVLWVLNPNADIRNKKLIVCDEASMVGFKEYRDLESYGVPILYLGDGFQLPSISDGPEDSVMFYNNGSLKPTDFALTSIHRQAENSPIIRYSRALRENRTDEIRFIGRQDGDGTLVRISRNSLSVANLAKAEQVIVGKNDTRHDVNASIREFLGRTSPYPEKGDKIIFLKNNKDHKVVNGMTGVALEDYYGYSSKEGSILTDVLLEDGRIINAPLLVPYFQHPGNNDALYETTPAWSRKKNLHADFGNAITCHKSQGSQYDNGILLNEPLGRTDELRRRWLYTGVTRFARNLIIAI